MAQGRRKRFDKDLYEKYNQKAVAAFKKVLPKKYRVEQPKKKTDVDLIVYKGDEIVCYAEVEVKRVWKEVDFPYEDVNLPSRKEKYCKLDKPTLFCIFNEPTTRVKCFWSQDVLASPKEEVSNVFIAAGELFFKIPLDCTFDTIAKAIREHEA